MGEVKNGKGYGGGEWVDRGGERGMEGPTTRFTISGVTLRGAEVPVRFSREGGKSAFSRPRVYIARFSRCSFLAPCPRRELG